MCLLFTAKAYMARRKLIVHGLDFSRIPLRKHAAVGLKLGWFDLLESVFSDYMEMLLTPKESC